MSGDLKRCPWCNHEVECLQRTGACFVYCDNCGCSGPRESTVESASSEWNRIAAKLSKVEFSNSAALEFVRNIAETCKDGGVIDQEAIDDAKRISALPSGKQQRHAAAVAKRCADCVNYGDCSKSCAYSEVCTQKGLFLSRTASA